MKGMSMRAAVVRKVGGPEVIEVLEVPTPEPGPLQVRIKVVAAALNPADAAVWAGFFGPLDGMEHAGLGLDAAGTIEAVGPGVLLEVGTAVIAFDAAVLRPTKAQAEFLVVDLNSLAPAPMGMDLTLAATIPLNAMTASQALDHLPLRPRDTLLVTGAAGAVGGCAGGCPGRGVFASSRRGAPRTSSSSAIAAPPGSYRATRSSTRRCAGLCRRAWTVCWTRRPLAKPRRRRPARAGVLSP